MDDGTDLPAGVPRERGAARVEELDASGRTGARRRGRAGGGGRWLMEPGDYRFELGRRDGPLVRCVRLERACLLDLRDPEAPAVVANAGFTRLELEAVRIVARREWRFLRDLAEVA